jgi:hypothetical protein
LPAPVVDTDFSLATGGGAVFGEFIQLAFPAGSDSILYRVAIAPAAPSIEVPWTSNDTELIAEQPDGELINVDACWTLAGVPVSPFCEVTSINVVA